MKWIYPKFSGKRTDNLSLLKQQQHLLHEGLEATAVVMDTTMYDDKVGNLFPVRLWLKLKKSDGTFIYTHAHSLVSMNHIPGKGQSLRIKYLPDNLSSVLILS